MRGTVKDIQVVIFTSFSILFKFCVDMCEWVRECGLIGECICGWMGESNTAGERVNVCGWMSAEVCVSVQWVGIVRVEVCSVCGYAM